MTSRVKLKYIPGAFVLSAMDESHPQSFSKSAMQNIKESYLKLGLDLQLGISKAESGSRFEKNSPPEVLTVVTGSIRHRS